jgi:hypothetical protein
VDLTRGNTGWVKKFKTSKELGLISYARRGSESQLKLIYQQKNSKGM